MPLNAYNDIIHDDVTAHRFLSKNCLKNEHRHCPRCNERKLYRLKDGRRRCSRCKYTFHDFSGRWINSGRLSAAQWLVMIRRFLSEKPALKVAEELELSYNTVLSAFTVIRSAVLAHAEDAVDFFCRKTGHVKCCYGGKPVCDSGRCAIEDVPIFGVLESGRNIRIRIVQGLTLGELTRVDVKKVRSGSIVYTDRFNGYDSLFYYGYDKNRVAPDDHYPPDYVYINRAGGFSAWWRKRFSKYYGVSSINFPLYLKETEFRYNYREADLFEILIRYICDVTPVIEPEKIWGTM